MHNRCIQYTRIHTPMLVYTSHSLHVYINIHVDTKKMLGPFGKAGSMLGRHHKLDAKREKFQCCITDLAFGLSSE